MAAETDGYSPKLQKRILKGHRKPVLCLAHSSERLTYRNAPYQHHHPSLLLSGSEDGTARLWDLRSRKSVLCMVMPPNEEGNDVTSVAFHPSVAAEVPQPSEGERSTRDTSDRWLPLHNDCTVYASAANRVYGYDLRNHSTASTAPIINTPHFDLS